MPIATDGFQIELRVALAIINYGMATLSLICGVRAIWDSNERRRRGSSLLGVTTVVSLLYILIEYYYLRTLLNDMEMIATIIYRMWVNIVFLQGILISFEYSYRETKP